MFYKTDRLNAGSLRLAKGVLVAALVTLMLYAVSNTFARCADSCYPPCPTINISCPTDLVQQGTAATVTVSLSDDDPQRQVTYNWTVSAGTIDSGQGTPTITVDTTGLAGQNITVTVEIGGLPSECERTRSCSFSVRQLTLDCTKFDEYNNLKFKDEKLRLDNLAIQLQGMSGEAQGYYFIFGSCEGEADQRSQRAVDYLVNTRGIDRNRISVTNGGCRETLTVELWICPIAPIPGNAATVDPCPKCKAKPKPRRGARRGRHPKP